MPDEKPKLIMYSLKELEEMTGIGLQTWRRYIKSGELTAHKIGRSYRVFPRHFRGFIDSKQVKVKKKK